MAIYFVFVAYIVLLALAVTFLVFLIHTLILAPAKGSPYAPTRRKQIEAMLDLAGVKSGEVVLDLGSGNGSVLIAAGGRGARAIGVEINPFFVWYSRLRIRGRGLSHLATVERRDMFQYPLGQADVIFLFLVPRTMLRIGEKLRREAKPGVRIVSHLFPLPGWTPRLEKDKIFLYQL